MTFDEWYGDDLPVAATTKLASWYVWEAATLAERERCEKIAGAFVPIDYGYGQMSKIGFATAGVADSIFQAIRSGEQAGQTPTTDPA